MAPLRARVFRASVCAGRAPLSGRFWYDQGMTICPACDTRLPVVPGRGRPRKYCGEACRSRYRRSVALPKAMTERKAWVRAVGKRPVHPDGSPASSTYSRTWSSFKDVQRGAGDGFGVMLGNGLGCYDLDNVSDEAARWFIADIPERIVFMERSVSGRGVHIFIEAPEGTGIRWESDAGVSVERYTQSRFIRVTGVRFEV